MITVLMVLDAVVGLLLIASVIMQTPKSAGMGMGGGSDTVFSSSARGLDALLAGNCGTGSNICCAYPVYCQDNSVLNFTDLTGRRSQYKLRTLIFCGRIVEEY